MTLAPGGLMLQIVKGSNLFKAIAALMLAAFLHGCMRWCAAPAPRGVTSDAHARSATLKNGAILVAKRPSVVGHSLVWYGPARMGVPLAQVKSLEARTVDPGAA